MRGNSTLQTAVGSAIEIVDPTKRVQLFPIGTWQGRNGLGPYTIADRAHAEKVIAATTAAQGPVELMFDYDHQAVRAPAVAGKAVASGWIKQLHAQDDGIWADVEWTEAAAAAIAAREYRYTSPYFLHDKAGNVTRIINAGLTNTPNFNLAAVAASSLTGEQSPMDELLKAILQALGLPEDATQEQAMAKIGELTGAATAMASATSVLGLAAGADGAAIASAITNIKAANDPAKFVPIEQLKHVNERLAAIEGDKHEAAVASAIAAGKLAPSLKDWAMNPDNRTAFASFIETAPVILAPGSSGGKKVDPKSDVVTDEERAIASSLGLSVEQFLQARKDGE